MATLAFLIYPTGELHTRHVLSWIGEAFQIVDVIRCRTTTRNVFREKMFHMYQEIGPSKLAKARAKIMAQGESTSFLVVIVEGDKQNIRKTKTKVRHTIGCNCVHSADNPNSVMEHIEWLLGKHLLKLVNFDGEKKIDLDTVYDFSYWDFRECGGKLHDGTFKDLIGIFQKLEDNRINYAVANMGVTVEENVYKHNKDIEIVCSDRTRAIDALGATFIYKPGMKKPHESTYLVLVDGRKVKLDFALSVFIPKKWRDHVLATRVLSDEGFYVPLDGDRYWLTMFERVIYKPRKRKPSVQHKYAEGAKWDDLVLWGINMGIHDQIRKDTLLEDCQKVVRKYMKGL